MKTLRIKTTTKITDDDGNVLMLDETDAIALVDKFRRAAVKRAALEAGERTIDAVMNAALSGESK